MEWDHDFHNTATPPSFKTEPPSMECNMQVKSEGDFERLKAEKRRKQLFQRCKHTLTISNRNATDVRVEHSGTIITESGN